MDDVISRQQAIDALRDYLVEKRCPNDGTLTCRLIENEVINKLPPATDKNVGTKLGTNLAEVGTDMISRQAAIDALEKCHKMCCREDDCGDEWIHYETALNEIESIPSAQPEVKQISYTDCANAMLMMWMDKVLTDSEYNRIMDKLNEHEKKKGEDNE